MKKLNFKLILTPLFICIIMKGFCQTNIDLGRIFQSDLEKDNKERYEKNFGNLKTPKPVKLIDNPDFSKLVEKVNNENSKSVNQNKVSQSIEKKEDPFEALRNTANSIEPNSGNAMNSTERYNLKPDENGNYPEEKLASGALGFNTNESMAQNEKKYKDEGYNISYKHKDSTILGIIFTLLLIIVAIIIFKDSFGNKFSDIKIDTTLKNSSNLIEKYNSALYYFNKPNYKKSLAILDDILQKNPDYLAAKKTKLSILNITGDYFEFEKIANGLIIEETDNNYVFNNLQKENFSTEEQSNIFFTIAKAKELNGNLKAAEALKKSVINLF